jgi:hypothetical protein
VEPAEVAVAAAEVVAEVAAEVAAVPPAEEAEPAANSWGLH